MGNQRRHALASAVAATACAPLVMARGHRVNNVSQLPLILEDTVGQVSKTRDVIAMLKNLGVWDDVRRVMANKQLRAGKGKMRDRRHKWRRGPLFVVDEGYTQFDQPSAQLYGSAGRGGLGCTTGGGTKEGGTKAGGVGNGVGQPL